MHILPCRGAARFRTLGARSGGGGNAPVARRLPVPAQPEKLASMGERAELIRRIYGFDWAGIRSRREGFGELRGLVTDNFNSQLSPELGERVLAGVAGLEMFVEAVEEDFSEFRYDADEIEEIGDDRVLVLGRIAARAR